MCPRCGYNECICPLACMWCNSIDHPSNHCTHVECGTSSTGRHEPSERTGICLWCDETIFNPTRIVVACINWGHPGVAHAVSYVLRDGHATAEVYHATWDEAMRRADELRTLYTLGASPAVDRALQARSRGTEPATTRHDAAGHAISAPSAPKRPRQPATRADTGGQPPRAVIV